jgi:hypothetical protein
MINKLADEFKRILGGVYYTAFQFREEDQATPSHYLLHITKGAKGFDLVKRVYSKYSNVEMVLAGMEDVSTYTFDPKSIKSVSWFDEDFKQENIAKLKDELCVEYKGQTLSTEIIFKNDQCKRMHAFTHYTAAFRQLFDEGRIDVRYIDGKKHKASVLISPWCIITFKS